MWNGSTRGPPLGCFGFRPAGCGNLRPSWEVNSGAAGGGFRGTPWRNTPVVADEYLRMGAEAWVASLSDTEFDRLVAVTRPEYPRHVAELTTHG
ncbi:Uncharacterised protein [Mycobacteroides abscessus subsp. bolletii]|nr:Uncharacterised protein [Mycobacteroides abscessus subsp. bolletii]